MSTDKQAMHEEDPILGDFVLLPTQEEEEAAIDKIVDEFELVSEEEIKEAMPELQDRQLLMKLINDLKQQDLSQIKTDDQFIQFVVDFGKKHGKTLDKEGIKKYLQATGIEVDKLLLSGKGSRNTHAELAMRLGLTAAGIIAVHWFSGPLAAVAARSLYSQAYGLLWGIPSAWNPVYWSLFLPGREHFGHLAYQWGPWAMNAIGGTLYHKGVDAAKWMGEAAVNGYQWARGNTTPMYQRQRENKENAAHPVNRIGTGNVCRV